MTLNNDGRPLTPISLRTSVQVFKNLSFIIRFMSLNIVIFAPKLAKVWHIDPILGHFLHLSKNLLTMETRNIKYDMTRTFPLSIG